MADFGFGKLGGYSGTLSDGRRYVDMARYQEDQDLPWNQPGYAIGNMGDYWSLTKDGQEVERIAPDDPRLAANASSADVMQALGLDQTVWASGLEDAFGADNPYAYETDAQGRIVVNSQVAQNAGNPLQGLVGPGSGVSANEAQAGQSMAQGFQPGTTRAELARWAEQNGAPAPPQSGSLAEWANQYYPGGAGAVYGQGGSDGDWGTFGQSGNQGATFGFNNATNPAQSDTGGSQAGSSQSGAFGFNQASSAPDFNVPNVPQAQDASPQNRVDRTMGNLEDYAAWAMSNPSRWDAQLVQQGLDVIDAAIGRARQRGNVNLSEQFAKRGLTGSSVEGQNMADFESQLQDQQNQYAWQLAQNMANTYAGDRASAFGFGTDVAQLALGQLSGDRNFNLSTRALDLDELLGTGSLDLQRQLGLGNLDLSRQGLDLQRQLGLGGLDLQQQQLNLQRYQVDVNNALQNRGLDLQKLSIENQQALSQMQTIIAALGLDIDPEVLLDMLGIGSSGNNTNTGTGGEGWGGGGNETGNN